MTTKKQALENVGGLSKTSKMPCYSWGISALLCNVGGKLAEVKDSVCADCYALKGFYAMPSVSKAHTKRLDNWKTNPNWVNDMALAIQKSNRPFFRVFDSGDLQSMKMLVDWILVAQLVPSVEFWLPTKEYGLIKQFIKNGGIVPNNMVIRVSSPMVDDTRMKTFNAPRVKASHVTTNPDLATCRAFENDGECKDCRACWNSDVESVTYLKH